MPSQSKYSTSLGVAGGVGFLYEMQVGPTYSPTRFLLDIGVGADYGMTAFSQGASAKVTLPNQQDLQGDVFDYVYEMQDRKDQYTNLAVRVPIMVGVQHRHFYMLAGVKVGANLLPQAHTKASIKTYGDYQQFDRFENMPEYQFFDKYELPAAKTKAGFNMLNMDVSFEIGGRLGFMTDAVGFDVPKRKTEYRLAAYVDYGVLDIHKGGTNAGFLTPEYYNAVYAYGSKTMVENIEVNDIMSTVTVDAQGNAAPFAKSVNNFMVGLKFTVLFQLPEEGQCVICRDAYRNSARRGGGRRGMKYEE